MQQRSLSTLHAELDAFLAAHLGRMHAADVGPLLGQVALMLDGRALEAQPVPDFQEAVNAALSPDLAVPGSPGQSWMQIRCGAAPAERGVHPLH